MNLLDIEVPMIAAVNGPVIIHAEWAVQHDIILQRISNDLSVPAITLPQSRSQALYARHTTVLLNLCQKSR